MAGADGVVRVIGAILAVVVIIFVGAVGNALVEPIFQTVIDPGEMQSLGWGTPQNTVFQFMGFGLVGLLIVVVVWLWAAPIRSDVRQDERRPPF